MARSFTVLIEQDEKVFVSEVVGLPGCHTQARSLDELMKLTRSAVSEYLEVKKDFSPEEKFVGLQKIEV
jgi:predicted RNase H-like HicB family nuclease